ncbi:peptidase family M48 protein [Medicago truncatula]|uniref:Peptidase family M48 protein n=1 Tax=Medicago truncatula TaxID=3880 RepID=A0A072UBW8_MEDTR|nr:peptidase family M48 protein [Medicago truncatula]
MEIEADYIGLLLVASAGYDPRVAPNILEKVIDRDSMLTDYRTTQHQPRSLEPRQNIEPYRLLILRK